MNEYCTADAESRKETGDVCARRDTDSALAAPSEISRPQVRVTCQ